jgi:predicted ribosomally synthesized peptide with SipW-like signal peptide
MTKRLLLSLAVISVALAGVAGATVAYFSSGKVLAGNTFATGNVRINEMAVIGAPIILDNLGPGIGVTKHIYFQYKGTLNTDIYLGAGGEIPTTDPKYFADHLNVYVADHNTFAGVWSGKASDLSTTWIGLAGNVAPDQWLDYDVTFTLASDTGNEHQAVTNTDTRLMLYSVQNGAPAPLSTPYLDLMATPVWNWNSF